MTEHTQHPAWPVPAAPERERTGHLMLRAWCVFVLFAAFAGGGWLAAFGTVGAGFVAAACAVVSAACWAIVRPAFNFRRLPWFVLAFVLWSVIVLPWAPGGLAACILLAITAGQGLFVAAVLTWSELVAALSAALTWMLGLSVVFELAVAVLVGGPLGPGFTRPADAGRTPWSLGDLFSGGALQGLAGDTGQFSAVCTVAAVVFGIRVAASPRRALPWLWLAVALFVLARGASAAVALSIGAVVVVLGAVLLMRTVRRAGGRSKYYTLFAAVGIIGAALLWLWRDTAFAEAPTAWAAAAQTGWVGVALLSGIQLSFVWRSWFFAIDRPRWDLRADRPYSPLTLLPTLVGAMLLVHSLVDVDSMALWGWLLIVTLGTKVTQAPLVGVGPAEHSAALERGDAVAAA